MPIRKKLILGFGVPIMLLLAGLLSSDRMIRSINSSVARYASEAVPFQEAVLEMEIHAGEAARVTFSYLRKRDPQLRMRLGASESEFERHAAVVGRQTVPAEQRRLHREVSEHYERFKKLSHEAMDIADRQQDALLAAEQSVKESGILILEKLRPAADEAASKRPRKLRAVLGMEQSIREINGAIGTVLTDEAPRLRQNVRSAKSEFKRFEKIYRSNPLAVDEKSSIDQMSKNFDTLGRLAVEIMNLEDAKRDAVGELEPVAVKLRDLIEGELEPLVKLKASRAKENALLAGSAYGMLILILNAFALILAATAAFVVTRGIRGPIEKLRVAVEEVGKGNLEAKIEAESEDEIGDLARSFSQMTRDLQETVVARDELIRANAYKDDFLNLVSHELRTPLSVIREGVSQVLDGVLGETTERQRKFMSLVLSGADRLGRLIEDLLHMSKLDSGTLALKRERVDLLELAHAVVSSFEGWSSNRGIALRTDLPLEGIVTYVDKDKVFQVLTNLIGNALKFTEKGFVEVSMADRGSEVICSVRDSGIGIDAQDLPNLFNEFQQFHRVDGKHEKGTGLGLAISKGLVELHGGTISAESKVGSGTAFTFNLPKFTAGEAFADYLKTTADKAIQDGNAYSLIIIEAKTSEGGLPIEDPPIEALIRHLGDVAREHLRRQGDLVIEDRHRILIALPNTGKENALMVAERLHVVLGAKLEWEGKESQIMLQGKIISAPEDTMKGEEFLRHVET